MPEAEEFISCVGRLRLFGVGSLGFWALEFRSTFVVWEFGLVLKGLIEVWAGFLKILEVLLKLV